MDCIVLVSAKSNSIPIQECGGVVLAEGDKLLVTKEIADRMLLQYGGYLVKIGTESKQSLRGGHYEYVYKGNKPQDKGILAGLSAQSDGIPELPIVEISADKSLFGKIIRRKKG